MAGGSYEWVQPIVVTANGSHEQAVRATAAASVLAAAHVDSPGWAPWLEGSFAKTVRRVKGPVQLARVTEDMAAAGHESFQTVEGDVLAVAFGPLPAADLPRPVGRLQVAGFERPRTGCWPEPSIPADVMVCLNAGVDMSTGKSAAQAAHALMAWLLDADPDVRDEFGLGRVSFRMAEVPSVVFDRLWPHAGNAAIADNGHTEVEPGTRTALAVSLSVFERMMADVAF